MWDKGRNRAGRGEERRGRVGRGGDRGRRSYETELEAHSSQLPGCLLFGPLPLIYVTRAC